MFLRLLNNFCLRLRPHCRTGTRSSMTCSGGGRNRQRGRGRRWRDEGWRRWDVPALGRAEQSLLAFFKQETAPPSCAHLLLQGCARSTRLVSEQHARPVAALDTPSCSCSRISTCPCVTEHVVADSLLPPACS